MTHRRNFHYLADYLVLQTVDHDSWNESPDPVLFLKGAGLVKGLLEVAKLQ